MVKSSPSNAGAVASIPGQGAEIPSASWPKNQNVNRSNIVANSAKTLKQSTLKNLSNRKSTNQVNKQE